ncbi:protein crossbronx homolog [Panonychus citri]|uniref:protein crossbronx homolog n=1 Tax=Panonychus citri TaxID=50023 RepID=UPI002308062D|nr:protein crossbronx homolog [Panonychus citri]
MTELSTDFGSSTTTTTTTCNAVESSGGVDRCSPLFVEYRLMKEFILFQQQTIQNIYLVPSHESPFIWFGVLFVHEGLYQGAVLRFTFNIPNNYPDCDGIDDDDNVAQVNEHNNNLCPSIIFDHPPFHPLIDPETGKFNSTKIISQWNPRVHQFWQLIAHLKKVFIHVEKELNYEMDDNSTKPEEINYRNVVKMYLENQELFVNKIAQTVESSKSLIYQPPKDKDDTHAIIFTEVDSVTLESWKSRLLNLKGFNEDPLTITKSSTPTISSQLDNNRPYIGLSWVQNDLPFSRPIV